MDRVVLGCAQRLVRRRDRRLAPVPRRRRGARRRGRRASCARSAARPGERPSTSSRRTSPATRRPARRSRTARCGCSATVPSTGSAGRLHEQIAHNLPGLPTRAARADQRPGRALRLPRRGARREGEVAPQHRTAARAEGREPRRRRSCTSTSAPSTSPPATPPAALAEFEQAWRDDQGRGPDGAARVHAHR